MDGTFIDQIETVVDEVSAWGYQVIKDVLEVLRPDGRGYGQEKVDIEDQLANYRLMRNDLNAWTVWINLKSTELQNILVNSGVQPDTIAAIDHVAIASAYALAYSEKMEAELAKRML